MENIGDYIYVLVFVGVIIFNLFQKVKKESAKPQPKPVEYEGEEETNPLKEIFNYETPKQPETVKTAAFNPFVQSQVPPRKPASKPVITQPEPENLQVIDIDFSDVDILRKGIVFAEVFNRKY